MVFFPKISLPRLSGREVLYLVLIINLALWIRLYHISYPIFDSHNFRQTDTYAMVLNFYEDKTNVLHPKIFQAFHEENTERYHLAEFPIYAYLVSLVFRVFGESLIVARLVNIFFSILASLALYIIGKRIFSRNVALFAGLIINFFPVFVFWGRAVTPDIAGLAFYSLSLAILLARRLNIFNIFISSLLFSGAVLTKPFYFAFIPLYTYIFYQRICFQKGVGKKSFNPCFTSSKMGLLSYKYFQLLVTAEVIKKAIWFLALPASLFVSWRLWILTFPPAVRVDPSITHLLHGGKGYIRYWQETNWLTGLFKNNLFGKVLTPLGGIFMFVGIARINLAKHRYRNLLNLWLFLCLLISYVVSFGSREHDYYLLPWIPLAALACGFFLDRLTRQVASLSPLKKVIYVANVLFIVYFLGIRPFIDYEDSYFRQQTEFYSEEYISDYKMIQEYVPEDAMITTLLKSYYDPFMLNTLRRKGFVYEIPSDEPCPDFQRVLSDLDHRRKQGGEFLVFQKNDYSQAICPRKQVESVLGVYYEVVYEGEEIILYKTY